jgi:hypothetical protein
MKDDGMSSDIMGLAQAKRLVEYYIEQYGKVVVNLDNA